MNTTTTGIRHASLIGLGALGVMFGAKLQHTLGADFQVIVDPARKRSYTEGGVMCNNEPCKFNYTTPEECTRPAELLLVGTKSAGLAAAIETARPFVGSNTVILSLLNGITSEEVLSEAFGHEKVLYAIAQGMDAVRVGRSVNYHSMGVILFGERDGTVTERVQAVQRLFESCGINSRITTEARRLLWNKLMMNVGVNQSVTAYSGTYRTVQEPGPARDTMQAAMREVLTLAKAEGIDLSEKDLDNWEPVIQSLNPDACPSMRQDAMAKRPSELELFAGTVLRLGKKHSIPTPTNQFLFDTITKMEASYPPRDVKSPV